MSSWSRRAGQLGEKIKRHLNWAECENGILIADVGNGYFSFRPCSCLPCRFLRIWSRVSRVRKALQASFWLSPKLHPGSLAELFCYCPHRGRETPWRNRCSLPDSPVLRQPFVPKQRGWFSSAMPHAKSQVFSTCSTALVHKYNKTVAVLATWKCQCHTKH